MPDRTEVQQALIDAVVQTREQAVEARQARDRAVVEALNGGVTPTELAASVGVSDRVWVYAARRRVENEADLAR